MDVVVGLPVEVRFLAIFFAAMLLAHALLVLAWLGAKGARALLRASRKHAVGRFAARSARAARTTR